jgi:hypothetical protein
MYLRHPGNLFNRYFRVPSDTFFDTQKQLLSSRKLDVVFVDGLHTYEQCHRDIVHALDYLVDDGIILVHDCIPTSAYAASTLPEFEKLCANPPGDWNREWCGDVWKSIVRLRIERPDLSICTLDTDFGIGVITKRHFIDSSAPKISMQDLAEMNFDDFQAQKSDLLVIRPHTILPEIVAALGGSAPQS